MIEKRLLDNRTEFIVGVAKERIAIGKRLSGTDLVKRLNIANIKSTYNLPYKENTRGIYKVLASTYDKLKNNHRLPDAEKIAEAFEDSKGKCAWWDKAEKEKLKED